MNSHIGNILRSTKRRQSVGFRPHCLQGGISMKKLFIASLFAATSLVSIAAQAQDAGDNGPQPEPTPTPEPASQPDTTLPPVTTTGLVLVCIDNVATYVQYNSDGSVSYYPQNHYADDYDASTDSPQPTPEPCTPPRTPGGLVVTPPETPIDDGGFVALPPPPPPPPLPPTATSNPLPAGATKGRHVPGPGGTDIFINPQGRIFVRGRPGSLTVVPGSIYVQTGDGKKPGITQPVVTMGPPGSNISIIYTPGGQAIAIGPDGQQVPMPEGYGGGFIKTGTTSPSTTPPKDSGAGQQPLKTSLPHLDDTPNPSDAVALHSQMRGLGGSGNSGAHDVPIRTEVKERGARDDALKSSAHALRSRTTDHGAESDLHASRNLRNSELRSHLSSAGMSRGRFSESNSFKSRFADAPHMGMQHLARSNPGMVMGGPASGRLMSGHLIRANGFGGTNGSGMSMMRHGESGGFGGFGGLRFGGF